MKILQICPIFPPTPNSSLNGVSNVVFNISKELVTRGHSVTIYTSSFIDDIEENKNHIIIDGINVYYFNYIFKYYTFFITPGIISELKKNICSFDAIHLHDLRCFQSIICYYYAKKFNIPYILQPHGSLPKMSGETFLKKLLDIMIGDRILINSDKIIALNSKEASKIKKFVSNEKKIKIIPNGINLLEFENLPKKGEFKKIFKIGFNEKIILYLGRLHKIKGIYLLIDACADLLKEYRGFKLVIAGPDDGELSNLKGQAIKLGIENQVLFTGPLYGIEKIKAFVDADVYVLPSIYDTFPITILEACACGTPVILTDRCGIAEDFIQKNVGIIINHDRTQLKKAILAILSDPDYAESMRENGKKLIREDYNWNIIAKQLEIFYQNLE
jgi:glycosyltransferase involved in cell wall biosynthesis